MKPVSELVNDLKRLLLVLPMVQNQREIIEDSIETLIRKEELQLQDSAEAARIADKYLDGEPIERRKALADDIHKAMVGHGENLALSAIESASAQHRPRRY